MAMMELISLARSSRYSLSAFLFVQRGLDYTVRRIHGELEEKVPPTASAVAVPCRSAESRHVSGTQLCLGLRDFATKEYGLLARVVLRRWNIHSTEDFGHIVFAMVDAGLMHKTDDDSVADFMNVFDFAEAFSPQLTLSEST
jgi:uncharacterized repeat protein (TIGR04138 family)